MDNENTFNLKATTLLFKAIWAVDKAGDYNKALKMYEKIIATGHLLADAYCGVGVCQKMLGNQEAAIIAAQEALLRKDDHYKTLQLLASIYNAQGNERETYEYVSRALANKPKTMTEMSPRLTDFARKALSGQPDYQVEDTVEFDYLDATWIAWAEEFKTKYEANHLCQTQEQNGNA
jgi:tetratricopeptide (TPR) repeat protein